MTTAHFDRAGTIVRALLQHLQHAERQVQIRPPRRDALRRDRTLDARTTLTPRIVTRGGLAYVVFERPAPQDGSTA